MGNTIELFDNIIDRESTGSEKWDGRSHLFGRADVTPLWVADMDFRAPAEVIAALKARAEHGIFGYRFEMPEEKEAVISWMRGRHRLPVSKEDILFSPGVVTSMFIALRALLPEGSLVAIQPPVYGPFYGVVERAGMRAYLNPLVLGEGGYRMDLNGLEDGLKKGVRALLLCSPHNPVGRVFTKGELLELTALLGRYGARLISDEIHADIVMPEHVHTPSLEVDERSVMLVSATKTFGLAGLKHSSIIVKDGKAREKIARELDQHAMPEPNLFGVVAQTAAYQWGGPWLDAMLKYLAETRAEVNTFFEAQLPDYALADLQGTYLQWVDARALNLKDEALVKFFVERAGVGLTGGRFFGDAGDGFVRINLATQRGRIMTALWRMKEAIESA